MVNSNEGLEALAALASAVPASADTGSGKDRNGSNDSNQNGPRGQDQQAGNHQNMLAPSAQGNTNGMQGQTPGSAPFPQIHNQQLQSVLQATATNPQWQQALAAASANATGTSSPVAQAPNANNNSNNNSNHQQINALANLQRQLQQADPSALMAIQQQLNYLNLLQLAQSNQHQQQQQQTSLPPPLPQQQANPQLQALQLALAGRNICGRSSLLGGAPSTGDYQQQQPSPAPSQVLPTATNNNNSNNNNMSSSMSTNSASTMPPPPPAALLNARPQQQQQSQAAQQRPSSHAAIAPQPEDQERDFAVQLEDRKVQKRAANRRSAQLSRKRKKQFIEELKDENDGLRRKEQILKSIPDLIVVFDSSGKLWFVSESVSRFLDFSSGELAGTSFWDRLCDDSVRLLKAAFMDSLAARQPDSDTAALGTGFWELRLVDKDGVQKLVTLNGVVHFAGDRPECVCSIRPQEVQSGTTATANKVARKEPANTHEEVSSDSQQGHAAANKSGGSGNNHHHYSAHHHKSLIRVKPQQSVVSNDRSSSESSFTGKRREGSIRISDSGNSSGISDSGSSDELNNDTAS